MIMKSNSHDDSEAYLLFGAELNKIITALPPGSTVFANNYFWLHGRKSFTENKNLSRELLRIRGSFFVN